MAILRLDLSSRTPAYEQIVRGIRTLLVAGRLSPGSALPTVRELAMDLGVHHNTVAEAYRLLADEGWLDLRRGRGALVVDRPAAKAPPDARAVFGRRLRELAAEAITEGLSRPILAQELLALAAKLREEEA